MWMDNLKMTMALLAMISLILILYFLLLLRGKPLQREEKNSKKMIFADVINLSSCSMAA